MNWPQALAAHVRWVSGGPFDPGSESGAGSDEVNHDPDSFVGEEDERGFDDDPSGAEPQFADDDGFDDAGEDDDGDEDEDAEDEEDED